jgi:hypothetical protein
MCSENATSRWRGKNLILGENGVYYGIAGIHLFPTTIFRDSF